LLRVLLVDDHAVVRGGVSRLLERAGGFTVVGEAGSGPEGIALARAGPVDVCVMDLDMPGGGISLVARLLEAQPGLRILVFSQHLERDFALTCIEAGALGYLSKDADPDAIVPAIRRVASGRRYLSEAAYDLALDLDRLTGDALLPHQRLSSRELEVVRMLSRGMRATDIAIELGISVKTVSSHRSNAMAKLGVANTVELAHYAREHGLV
jgi:two-component system invasion response regulator UvrY